MTNNRIQQLCTGEVPLVMGAIYGLRQWQWSPINETLYGHAGQSWPVHKPLEAGCKARTSKHTLRFPLPELARTSFAEAEILQRIGRFLEEEIPDVPIRRYSARLSHGGTTLGQAGQVRELASTFREDFVDKPWVSGLIQVAKIYGPMTQKSMQVEITVTTDPVPHDVTDPNCTCGIYAYTDTDSLLRNSRDFNRAVFGLVKAYGLVTQGTHGFRAQKAEIVALTSLQEEDLTTFGTAADWHQIPVDDVDVLGFHPSVPRSIRLLPTLDALFDHAEPFLKESRLEP